MVKIVTDADLRVWECLARRQSFALIAGAGSGKTDSLVDALKRIRDMEGGHLRQNGQQIACITYTKRAVKVIQERLGFDDLYAVSTIHSFLWSLIRHFHRDVRQALHDQRIPELLAKAREKSQGNSKTAREARTKIVRFEEALAGLSGVLKFNYSDAVASNYLAGDLSHDDVVALSSILLATNHTFRRIVGLRYPFIFVDEAQDTSEGIVTGLNLVCEGMGLPLVGYFGDPWQQIHEGSTGEFAPPHDGETISKTENFRCSESVIRLLNRFRDDVTQYAAGDNAGREGSVLFRLVRSEAGEAARNCYSDAQLSRASEHFDRAVLDWGWSDDSNVIQLFLARQMIARRLGFSELNKLFTGNLSSSRSQEAYESGGHFLLQPLTETIWPLVRSHLSQDARAVIDVLRRDSPAFDVGGVNAGRSLKAMLETASSLASQITDIWATGSVRDVLRFCIEMELISAGSRLRAHIDRSPREEPYNDAIHTQEKGDWLADAFLSMRTGEIAAYASFIAENTPYSTQHGVKGEQYKRVLVVYDDIEANWSNYNFSKLLTPQTAGAPTDGQRDRGRRLAYVSFSRALSDLRVLLFTPDPEAARAELISSGLLTTAQVELV